MIFRIFPLDARGRYLPPLVLDCETDEAAIAAAVQLGEATQNGFDIWQLGRLVGRFTVGPDGVPVPAAGGAGQAS